MVRFHCSRFGERLANDTYEVHIYIGGRAGYDGDYFTLEQLKGAIFDYQISNPNLMPVRITPTCYYIAGYDENGWDLATLAYPRKPYQHEDIDHFMFGLARNLLLRLRQKHITVVTPLTTYTFEEET